MNIKKRNKTGFSLIELSVVLIIISVLLSTFLTSSTTLINSRKNKVTRDRMEAIYKAMGNFLVANGRLPCPADVTAVKTDSDYGIEVAPDSSCSGTGVTASDDNSNLVHGMVPVISLGLSIDMAEDGFGNKISYFVNNKYIDISTDSSSSGDSTFGTAYMSYSADTLTYPDESGKLFELVEVQDYTDSNQTPTSSAILVLLSHGANEYGAYPAESSSVNSASTSYCYDASNDIIETSGCSETSNFDYYMINSVATEGFDDIVLFKTRDQIIEEFKAYSSIPCGTIDVTLYGTTITWPQGKYNQLVAASTECPSSYRGGVVYPTRRCGKFGEWGNVLEPCAAN